jgi:isoquinoline 1-oxidoreductase beta subunit
MLVSAVAKRWNVDPASCRDGKVLHAPTTRSSKYGELPADAARSPVLESQVFWTPN